MIILSIVILLCLNHLHGLYIYNQQGYVRQILGLLQYMPTHILKLLFQYEYYRFNVSNGDGYYVELLNSDQHIYSGYGCINNYDIHIENNEIGIKIPSFGAIVLKHKKK